MKKQFMIPETFRIRIIEKVIIHVKNGLNMPIWGRIPIRFT